MENEQLSTWKCHVVSRKQRKFIIECQFRVPTSHQYTTTTTKRDTYHLMPNDSDLSCQSESNSPELEPPLVVELELEPHDDDVPESLPQWETSDKLSDSASPSIDSGSEGTSASETFVFRRLVPLSLRLPRKLRTRLVFQNSAATAERSYSAHGAQSQTIINNCSIISIFSRAQTVAYIA